MPTWAWALIWTAVGLATFVTVLMRLIIAAERREQEQYGPPRWEGEDDNSRASRRGEQDGD